MPNKRARLQYNKTCNLNEIDLNAIRLSEFIYYLPLDIKIKIFYMAVCNHMHTWNQEHYTNMWYNYDHTSNIKVNKPAYNLWSGYILLSEHKKMMDHNKYIVNGIYKYSCLELIKKLGLISQKKNIEWGDPEVCIRVPIKYTNKLCRQKKTIDTNNPPHRYIINEKVETYRIDNSLISLIIYEGIRERKLIGEDNDNTSLYWVENKCRCYTCDLVRFTYRSYSNPTCVPSKAWSLTKGVSVINPSTGYSFTNQIDKVDWYNTYDELKWNGNQQWKNVRFENLTKKQKKSLKKHKNLH